MLTDPVVHPEVRKTICEKNGRGSNAAGPDIESSHGEDESDIAQGDKRSLRRGEYVGSRIQMTLLVARRSVAVALGQALLSSTGIHQNVSGPTKDLVEDERSDSDDGRVGG